MPRLMVTYMEMTSPISGGVFSSAEPAISVKQETLNTEDYLKLYRAIGNPVMWDSRLRITEQELVDILQSNENIVYTLRQDTDLIGFCEFTRHSADEIELLHFGVLSSLQGRGYGRLLLDTSLHALWATNPKRIWLHTDVNDHPGAIPMYERHGFEIYLQQEEDFPEELPEIAAQRQKAT